MSTETKAPPPATDRGGVRIENTDCERIIEKSVSSEILQGRNAETLARFAAAASAALPVGELDAQALGSRSAWGTSTRPGRIEARRKSIRVLVRAAERAMEERPELRPQDVCAALRSLAFSPSDLLICPLTGAWSTTAAAVKSRGHETARAIAELALLVREIGNEVDHG